MKIYAAQINVTVGDFKANEDRILTCVQAAYRANADLVVFPELTVTGYSPEDLLFRASFITRNLAALRRIAQKTPDIHAIVGFVDRDKRGRIYNAAAVLHAGKIKRIYHKTSLPNYGVFDEKRYFVPGTQECIFVLKGKRVGITICEDIWQEDAYVYRSAFKGKVDLLINISASPYHRGKQSYRESLVVRLAKKINARVLYVNLIGGQDELVFDGGSLLADPRAGLISRLPRFMEGLYPADAGLAEAPLRYEEEVYRALLLGTRDYVRKNGFKKALIGLSGGIDSALVARIAVDALGAHAVLAVTMPSDFTSRETLADARRLAGNLGIECLEIPIRKVFASYLDSLRPIFAGRKWDTTEENLQARIRGNLIMALSNKFGAIVLTTGNKSEFATGYCTLYGDMAGGFAVLKDVPKTLVFKLAAYRNGRDGRNPSIPTSILKRAPSAELRKNQKDQDTLPPYATLDRILEGYIVQDKPLDRLVSSGITRALASKVARMVDMNEYKRRQAPPGIKITPRSFGRDRRMPITARCEL